MNNCAKVSFALGIRHVWHIFYVLADKLLRRIPFVIDLLLSSFSSFSWFFKLLVLH